MIAKKTLAAVLASSFISYAHAEDREATLVNRNTTLNLIEALVKRGVLDRASADAMIRDAQAKAVAEAKEEIAREAVDQAKAAGTGKAGAPAAAGFAAGAESATTPGQAGKGKPGSKPIHVGYVPEFVKQEIREQVRAELKADVLKDVKQAAQAEKWTFAELIPTWINRINPYFDLRLRLADELYDPDNAQAFDWLQINKDGGVAQAIAKNEAFLNTRIDRFRLRERFRVGFDAQVAEGLRAGFRFATSNMFNPVSNDQTLGNTGQSYQFAIDRGFLEYTFIDQAGNDWFTLWGGRFANPFVSTDVVYDPDLSFEGVAGTFRWHFLRNDPGVKSYRAAEPTARFGINQGPQTPDSVFITGGVFPIQDVNFSSADKWLFGGQLGADWLVFNDSRLKIAASYYGFRNISARRNGFESHLFDWTAPQFIQKGNSLVAINDGTNQPECAAGSLGTQNVCLVGLASGFEIFNATAIFDFAAFAPTHVLITGDFAKNFGFNRQKIFREFGDDIAPRTNAYQARIDVGRPELRHFNDWNLYFAYRYLERDAVLDAFTDSIFHQGGTDAKGWVVGAQYGLARNTWVNFRWFSTDAIDGPPLSIDTLNLDLNARF